MGPGYNLLCFLNIPSSMNSSAAAPTSSCSVCNCSHKPQESKRLVSWNIVYKMMLDNACRDSIRGNKANTLAK